MTNTINSTENQASIGIAPAKAHGQTGPKSQAGKNRSRWNALKDGASAKSTILPFEDEAVYRRHIKEVRNALAPSNYIEEQFSREYAEALWRIVRHEKRAAYEREKVLSQLTAQDIAKICDVGQELQNYAPDFLLDPKHRISKKDQARAQLQLSQFRSLMKNAKGIANFNLVWRQYPELFEDCGCWMKTHLDCEPLFNSTGQSLQLAWQQNPQVLLDVLSQFAGDAYYRIHFEAWKPQIRVWMESWFFLQRHEMRRLEGDDQLLFKERNYAYGILEKLTRFRKSNAYLASIPGDMSLLDAVK